MKKYVVSVTKCIESVGEVLVEASSRKEAKKLAEQLTVPFGDTKVRYSYVARISEPQKILNDHITEIENSEAYFYFAKASEFHKGYTFISALYCYWDSKWWCITKDGISVCERPSFPLVQTKLHLSSALKYRKNFGIKNKAIYQVLKTTFKITKPFWKLVEKGVKE